MFKKRYFVLVLIAVCLLLSSCFSSFGLMSSSGRGTSAVNDKNVSVDVFEDAVFNPETDVFYIATRNDDLAWATRLRTALTDLGFNSKTVYDYNAIEEKYVSGTAFFIGPNTLVTCSHVIIDENNVSITYEGKEVKAKVLYNDKENDIAVISVDVNSSHYFNFIPSSNYKLADSIFALGYPMTSSLGNNIRVTNGTISALSGLNGDTNFIQISAPIQPGNSGGPAINADFNVVGVVSSKISDAYTIAATNQIAQNVNFAIKSDLVDLLVKSYRGTDKSKFVSNMDEATACTVIVASGEDKNLGAGNKYFCEFSYKVNTANGYFTTFTLSIINLADGKVLGSIKGNPGKSVNYDLKTTKNIVNYLLTSLGYEIPSTKK